MRWLSSFALFLVLVVSLAGVVSAQGPALTVHAPASGASIADDEVVVEFQATDFAIVPSTVTLAEAGKRPDANRPGEGHVHLMLDLLPVVVWERAEPYTFSGILPGEHLLMVELVNNDHSSLSPPVVQQIQFQTVGPVTMPTTGQMASSPFLWLASLGALLLVLGFVSRRRYKRVS
jgi:hypothetical protein